MDFEFVVNGEGLVDVLLRDEDLPILSDALSDSVGTRPPRGARQDGPSTYWLDHALNDLRARLEDSSEEAFASGNITYLQLKEGVVEARYDYDDVASEYVNAVAGVAAAPVRCIRAPQGLSRKRSGPGPCDQP